MREDLADGPWFGDERDQSDVAATRRALERKLLPHAGHEFGPGNPGGVVRAGLLLRVAAAFRAVTVTRVPACHGIALLANVPDRQRRDGRPERVIQVLETLKIAGHVAVKERDPDTRVDGKPAARHGPLFAVAPASQLSRFPETTL